jgi:hypothetical protein
MLYNTFLKFIPSGSILTVTCQKQLLINQLTKLKYRFI